MDTGAGALARGRCHSRFIFVILAALALAAAGILLWAPAALAETYTVTVNADDPCGTYVCDLNGGDSIDTSASGYWYMGGTEGGGPDGIRWAHADEPDVVDPNAEIGTLIAFLDGNYVGSPYAALGSHGHAALYPSESGQLYLLFNDRASCYSDNSGCVTVTVVVTRASCGEQKSIQVVSPNGGDNWPIGSQQKTTWKTTGSIPYVDICISRDSGQSWKIVDENVPNTSGVYESVTATVGSPASDNCLIGVGDSSTWNGHGYGVWGQSDSTFRITSPVVTYSVAASVNGGHGTVSPGSQSIQAGGSADVTMSPDSGYVVGKVTDNGADVTSQVVPLYGGGEGYSDYRLVSVQANHTVVVAFASKAPAKYHITTVVSAGVGTISPANPDVTAGSSVALTITPSSGYEIDHAYVDGAEQTVPQRSTFTVQLNNVQGPHTVTVSFRSTASGGTTSATGFSYPFEDPNWTIGYNVNPTVNADVTSGFGVTWDKLFHAGVDWGGTTTTAVHAIGAGKILWVGGDYPGPAVVIEHTLPDSTKVYSVYMHLSGVTVSVGDSVTRGQVIATGLYNQTYQGRSNVHLHWEVRYFYDARTKFPKPGGGYYCYDSGVPGPGYTYPGRPDSYGWTDPVQFVTTHSAAASVTFSDVSSSSFSYAIDDIADAGIINGFSDGSFGADQPLTRQQFAKMIVKALGLVVTGNEVCPFADVDIQTGSDPFYPSKYVAVCAAHGITAGKTTTTFAPNDSITREQLITMIARALGLATPPSSYVPSFAATQFSLAEHYANACEAEYAGLLNGLAGPYFDFTATATRGECAQILYNMRHR